MTRVFAMPFNGQCLNVGRVEESADGTRVNGVRAQSGWLWYDRIWAIRSARPGHGTTIGNRRHRCETGGLCKKDSPDFEVEIWASQIGGTGGVGLLVVTHGQFGGDGFEVAKKTTCAVVGAGGEIEFGARRASGVVTAGGGAVAGAESPEAANGECLSGCVLYEADELTSGEIVGGNGAATIRGSGTGELAYEQFVAKDAEVERREGYAPGRIEPVSVFEAFKELTIGGEDVDVPEAGAIGFQGVAFLVEDEGDDDVVTDGLDVEGHEVPRKTIVREGFLVFVAVVPIGICHTRLAAE